MRCGMVPLLRSALIFIFCQCVICLASMTYLRHAPWPTAWGSLGILLRRCSFFISQAKEKIGLQRVKAKETEINTKSIMNKSHRVCTIFFHPYHSLWHHPAWILVDYEVGKIAWSRRCYYMPKGKAAKAEEERHTTQSKVIHSRWACSHSTRLGGFNEFTCNLGRRLFTESIPTCAS